MNRSRNYRDDLLKSLTDPEEAKEYLNAALEDENPEIFLLALKDIVDANSQVNRRGDSRIAPTESCGFYG